MTADDYLLTPREVAARLRVSRDTVYRWVQQGKLQGKRLFGDAGPVRITRASVEELMAVGEDEK